MSNKRAVAIRIVEQSAGAGPINLNLRVTALLTAPHQQEAFLQKLTAELQAFGVEVQPETFEFSEESTFGDVVHAVYRTLPGGDDDGRPRPAEEAVPDLEASLRLADKVEGMGLRKQGLVFFLAAAVMAAAVAAVWPRKAEPVLPGLRNPTIVAVGLKPGGLQPPAGLPACVVAVLSATGSTADPPRPFFSPAWLTAVRPQSDRTWADLALSQGDAAELAQQLGKYDVQILRPMHPNECAPIQNPARAPTPEPHKGAEGSARTK